MFLRVLHTKIRQAPSELRFHRKAVSWTLWMRLGA
jgi:hypothetical protein